MFNITDIGLLGTQRLKHVPLFALLLQKCLPPQVYERSSTMPSLCLCSGILLKLRNSHINVVQGMISLLLKSCNSNQQVVNITVKQ